MKFTVTQKIFSKFPSAKFGALLIEGVDNSKVIPELETLHIETVREVASKFKDQNIKELPEIRSWREVFKQLDLNREFFPSHEALLMRVISKKSLPRINPLVDIYNIISLKHLIPIGGHDTDKAPSIRIDETSGKETFQTMNTNEIIKVKKGEFAYICEDKILTRNFVWRQGETSKTNENTKSIFIPIDNVAGDMTKDNIKAIAFELAELITKNLGGKAKFGFVYKEKTEVDFSKEKELRNIKSSEDLNKWKKYQDLVKLPKPQMGVITDEKKIDEVITRGVKEVFPSRENLKKVMMSGKRLRIYTGIDPTGDFLHVGHFIWMDRLAKFQQLGHEVIFLIGAFTGMIGDPDKRSTREPLTKEQVWKNFESYKDTASKFINFEWKENPVTILNNYDWLSKVTLEDWLEVMGSVTLQHILSHDMFEKRLKEELPIRLHETMYPLMQGFDGVVMQVDLEQGGTDQTFNMLTGRILSRELINKEKFVLTYKLLTDSTGEKMGKTTGNAISSKDLPKDMFGKIMSWPDESLLDSFELLTDFDLVEIRKELKVGKQMLLKKKLAFEIVKKVKSEKEAQEAQAHFEQTVQKRELPQEIVTIDQKVFKSQKMNLLELLKIIIIQRKGDKGLPTSNAEIKRLIKQGGIQVDGKVILNAEQIINLTNNPVIKIGKRYFVKIKSR